MRFRALIVLLFALFAGGLPAQERPVRVETEDGRELHGILVRVTREQLVLRTSEGVVSLSLDQVVSYDDSRGPRKDAEPDDPAELTPESEEPAGDATTRKSPPPAGGAKGSTEPATLQTPKGALGYLPDRLGWLGDRYLWLVPAGWPQVVSTVLLLIFLLGLCLQLGARVAAVEDRSFARCLIAATVVVVLGGAEVAAVPFHWIAVLVAVVANFALWGLLMASLFGVRFFQGMTVLLTVGFCALIAFLVLEVVDYSLQVSHGVEV